MINENEEGSIYSHTALSKNWHFQCIIPDNMVLLRQEISERVPCHNHAAAEILYIEKGSGKLTVNGQKYRLSAGNGCILFTHHFHEITSSYQDPLILVSCRFSYQTYFFLSALLPPSKYLPHNNPFCAFAKFSTSEQLHCMRIIKSLFAVVDTNDSSQYISLLLEWVARFLRNTPLLPSE